MEHQPKAHNNTSAHAFFLADSNIAQPHDNTNSADNSAPSAHLLEPTAIIIDKASLNFDAAGKPLKMKTAMAGPNRDR